MMAVLPWPTERYCSVFSEVPDGTVKHALGSTTTPAAGEPSSA
jgi:hypothetical protein